MSVNNPDNPCPCPFKGCGKQMKAFWGNREGCTSVHTDGTKCETKTGVKMDDPPMSGFEMPAEAVDAH